jgi:non-ribosomal peptide synthetase component F
LPVQTYRGATERRRLAAELTGRLKQLSRQHGATSYMTLLAAFNVLLWRYTGEEDIVVGSPIANRNRQEMEGLIGFFVNTLVIRTDVSRDPSFAELVSRVREVTLDAYAHQDLPFEKLVEELKPERDLSRSPLFQVMFVYQNAPQGELRLHGLEVDIEDIPTGASKFDLTLTVTEVGQELQATLEYSTDLFDADRMQRLLEHWECLLHGVAEDWQQRISRLPLLAEAERRQVLETWNATERQYPKRCLHELIEEQVERTPDAVAVVFGAEQLTYRELDRRANQLAHHLRKLGVGPEVCVGLHLERDGRGSARAVHTCRWI